LRAVQRVIDWLHTQRVSCFATWRDVTVTSVGRCL